MADKYLGFTYRDIHSSTYKAYIKNEGNDLTFFNTPSFTNEFSFPQFGTRSIYLGNTKESREINLDLILLNVSLNEYKRFLQWINLDDIDFLSFDYNENFAYKVKINSISNGIFFVEKNCEQNRYNVELNVSFITVDDYAAHWIKKSEEGMSFNILTSITNDTGEINNNYDVPFLKVNRIGDTLVRLFLYNFNILDTYYKVVWETTNADFTLDIGEYKIGTGSTIVFYSIENYLSGTIFTEFAIGINNLNKQFIPIDTGLGTSWIFKTPSNIEYDEENPVYSNIMSISYTGFNSETDTLKIIPISREVI